MISWNFLLISKTKETKKVVNENKFFSDHDS